MKKIRANNLIVMYKVNGRWKAIAFATSCEIDISADMIEISSTVSGKWKTFKKKEKGWKISTAYLKGNVKKTPDLFELLDSDDPIQVCLTTVEAHPDIITQTEYKQDGRYQLTGSALVVRLTETARKGDMVTVSAELQGNGLLEQVWAPWVFVNGLWSNSGVWIDEGVWE
jgi:predicted secreted protein